MNELFDLTPFTAEIDRLRAKNMAFVEAMSEAIGWWEGYGSAESAIATLEAALRTIRERTPPHSEPKTAT